MSLKTITMIEDEIVVYWMVALNYIDAPFFNSPSNGTQISDQMCFSSIVWQLFVVPIARGIPL